MSGGSLLRLFKSEYFDAHLHMHYLHHMEQSGVQDYLVNELYKMTDADVDFYLPQLCQISLLRYQSSSLHRFLLDKASLSMHFALKIHWLMQSAAEDRQPELWESALAMVNSCESAIVNSAGPVKGGGQNSEGESQNPVGQGQNSDGEGQKSESQGQNRAVCQAPSRRQGGSPGPLQPRSRPSSPERPPELLNEPGSSSRSSALRHLAALAQAHPAEAKAQVQGLQPGAPNAYLELGEPVTSWLASTSDQENLEGGMRKFMMKRRRCDYFNTQTHLVSMIIQLASALVALPEKPERLDCLRSTLGVVNRWLLDRHVFMACSDEGDELALLGLHIPITKGRDSRQQILRIHEEQCRIFSSASRAPFLLVYETADLDEAELEKGSAQGPLASCVAAELAACAGGDGGSEAPEGVLWSRILATTAEAWHGLRATALTPAPPRLPSPERCARCPQIAPRAAGPNEDGRRKPARTKCPACRRTSQAAKIRQLIWGEAWEDRMERIRCVSPYGRYRSWALEAIVVKGGDDLRQELLASQIIEQFGAIFKEAQLPLWLKATKVLVTNSSSGFIEFIQNSTSIDAMKQLYPGKTLADIFKVAFADRLFEATQNFIESCAAYSLVIWFLQVKDRHNGNLMMDSSGHVIHIDFGFMLSNSPGGNMAFEQSPFKLTQEFIDVMGGESSEQYEYFRTLVIRGFLESRKHMERIILQVRMMLAGSRLPCFREGSDFVLQSLHDRFFMNLTEEACIEKIVDLIDSSVNNWRTIQYDNYQRLVNGIL